MLGALADRSTGLFPRPDELDFSCSCPDGARMCKHIAAVIYGVGARLDTEPSLFFLLRGVDVADLHARSAKLTFATGTGGNELGDADLGSLFGIELAPTPVPVPPPRKAAAPVLAAQAPPTRRAPGRRAPAPPKAAAAPGAYAPITDADFDGIGIDPATVAQWARSGVVLPTDKAGTYTPTDETGPQMRAYLVARRRGR